MNEPTHCPKCQSTYIYQDRGFFHCPECAHEWTYTESAAISDELEICDANGTKLQDGDTVSMIKDLKVKDSSSVVKAGTKVRGMRLVDGNYDISCKIPVIGSLWD